jgi:hypothetical protein
MKLFQVLIVSFLIIVNSISIAFCQDVTLSWDPSPTPEVDGYKVYYKQDNMNFPFDGTGADQGVSPVDVGNVLTTTLTNLNDGVTYFFSVTAYDNDVSSESNYSNIVSNSWLPALVIPAAGATNEPVPVTFQWETAPSDYNVSYTLFYGTDQDEVRAASSIVTLPSLPGNNSFPTGVLLIFAALLLIGINYRAIPQVKVIPQAASFLLVVLLGGILTACSGGGGGDTTTTDRAASTTPETAPQSVLYSINKGSSDYHQAYDLTTSTTYYWKVVATDTLDPNLTYESEVRQFSTEAF